MLKNITQLECIIEGKSGRFHCDSDTPLHFVKEMLFQFQKYIGQIEDNVKAQQEAQKKVSEEIKTEEPPQA